jgi:hypothetical protein
MSSSKSMKIYGVNTSRGNLFCYGISITYIIHPYNTLGKDQEQSLWVGGVALRVAPPNQTQSSRIKIKNKKIKGVCGGK